MSRIFKSGTVVGLGESNILSTESWTGRYINGEKIYQKMVVLGSVSTGYTQHSHGISNINRVTSIYGYFIETGNDRVNKLPISPCDNMANYGIDIVDFNSTTFFTLVGSRRSISSMNVCIEYTKTTG